MKWFKRYVKGSHPELPSIDQISVQMPAVSEYFEIFRLPSAFKSADSDTIPIISTDGTLVGIVTEYDLAKVLPEWSFEDESYRYNFLVGEIMTREVWAEFENVNIENLLERIHEMHVRVIPIVTTSGKYTGRCVTRAALISYLTGRVKPYSIGGLATPLGVYMTDGKHQAGSGNIGLVSAGVVFASIIYSIDFLVMHVQWLNSLPDLWLLTIKLCLFIFILRISPLVKLHAAEHQTITAIEKGLPLSLDTVRVQPRPHIRCGTNIMVLVTGILLVIKLSEYLDKNYLPLNMLYVFVGFYLVFSKWRAVGMWVQEYFTTAKAGDGYLLSGIFTGKEILKLHKEDVDPSAPTLGQKIWNMGFVQIFVSFMSASWLIDRIMNLLGFGGFL